MLAALLALTMICAAASAKTKLTKTWADPSAANYTFTKVLVAAVIDHPEVRRNAEAAMASHLKKARTVLSCTVLTKGEERDKEALKKRLAEEGFDGVIVMRPFPSGETAQYVAPLVPNSYTSYYSYSAYNWPVGILPSYAKYDRIVRIETLFFSLKDDKLLWSGMSETSNPADATALINSIAESIRKELKKQKILK
jgi:hypothetical protein